MRPPAVALGVLLVAGGVLRFAGLGDQSYWRDEGLTVLDLEGSLGHLWTRLVEVEGIPPLYYLLAWPWSKVLGDGEAGLRSLSAVLGTATIPVTWALGRRLAGRGPAATGAAALAAAFAAFDPFLVWYAQEARAYALLALVGALATLALVTALQDGGRRPVVLWGLAAAAGLATHWFAVFLLVPQAVVLIARRRREAVPGLAIAAATALALLPLLLAQRDGRVDWIRESASLAARTSDVAKHWLAGPLGSPLDAAVAAAGVLLAGGVVVALRRRAGPVPTVLGVVAASVALPLVLAAGGVDYVLDRYLIAALVPLLAVAAAGLAGGPAARTAAGAALAAILLALTVDTALDEDRHREDWRGVAGTVRAASERPAVLVAGLDGEPPLAHYLPQARPPAPGTAVREVVLAASWRFGRPRPPTPPPPSSAFRVAERSERPTTTVVRYVAGTPQPVDPAALAALALDRDEGATVLLVP